MACSRNFLVFLCVALGVGSVLLVGTGDVFAEQKPAKDDSGKAAASMKKKGEKGEKGDKGDRKAKPAGKAEDGSGEKDKEKEKGEKEGPKLSIPLPEGQDSKGVVIPYTDESGRKTMSFRIGVGRKLDPKTVKMTNLTIEIFNDAAEREMAVELPSAMLDVPSRVITGDQTVTITRSDFKITGQRMEFNTETRKGWIKGDVKMIIYDLSEETGDEPKKEAPGKDAPKPQEEGARS
jgi:hypothetical protein